MKNKYQKPDMMVDEIVIEDILLPSGVGIGSQNEEDFAGTDTDVWGNIFN